MPITSSRRGNVGPVTFTVAPGNSAFFKVTMKGSYANRLVIKEGSTVLK